MRADLSVRGANAAGFVACALLLGYAYYSQFHDGLEPCPLCIFQRVGVFVLGLVFLVAALHGPRSRTARIIYAVLLGAAALLAAGIAARHVYVQAQPPGTIAACGAPLEFMMRSMSPAAVIRRVLTGSGECGVVNWTFLGLAMPAWVLICSLLLGAWGVLMNVRRPRAAL